MKQGERSPLGLYTIGIAALFLAGFFLLVVFGAQSYRNTVAGQDGNDETRALLSYLATVFRANDTAGAVSVEEGEYGQTLIVADGDTGYALHIYRYEGSLVEEYAALSSPLSPEGAQIIAPTEKFELRWLSDKVLAAETDAGRVLLCARAEGGGAS